VFETLRWLLPSLLPAVLLAVGVYRSDRTREPVWLVSLTFGLGLVFLAYALSAGVDYGRRVLIGLGPRRPSRWFVSSGFFGLVDEPNVRRIRSDSFLRFVVPAWPADALLGEALPNVTTATVRRQRFGSATPLTSETRAVATSA
jgi:hypothetical protein